MSKRPAKSPAPKKKKSSKTVAAKKKPAPKKRGPVRKAEDELIADLDEGPMGA